MSEKGSPIVLAEDFFSRGPGLVLFGEFLHSLGLKEKIDLVFGAPGSGAGYPVSNYVLPLLHCMNRTENAFRLIVVRRRVPNPLPGIETDPVSFETRYKVLATSHKEIPEWIVDWLQPAGRGVRKPEQGAEDWVRDGADAQREHKGQRGFFPDRRPGLQPLSPVPGADPLRRIWPGTDPDGAMAGLPSGRERSYRLLCRERSRDPENTSIPDRGHSVT